MLITVLAITAAILTAALWLMVRSWPVNLARRWALAWSVMALFGLVELWVAHQNAMDWEAAYLGDIGELQK